VRRPGVEPFRPVERQQQDVTALLGRVCSYAILASSIATPGAGVVVRSPYATDDRRRLFGVRPFGVRPFGVRRSAVRCSPFGRSAFGRSSDAAGRR